MITCIAEIKLIGIAPGSDTLEGGRHWGVVTKWCGCVRMRSVGTPKIHSIQGFCEVLQIKILAKFSILLAWEELQSVTLSELWGKTADRDEVRMTDESLGLLPHQRFLVCLGRLGRSHRSQDVNRIDKEDMSIASWLQQIGAL